jgi:hypothetical protein
VKTRTFGKGWEPHRWCNQDLRDFFKDIPWFLKWGSKWYYVLILTVFGRYGHNLLQLKLLWFQWFNAVTYHVREWLGITLGSSWFVENGTANSGISRKASVTISVEPIVFRIEHLPSEFLELYSTLFYSLSS